MKWTLDAQECPKCGVVFKVLQVPWPYTGEYKRVDAPRCPWCGNQIIRKDVKQ